MTSNLESRQDNQRVSTLEIFFDLVFVFTVTQLTVFVEHNLSLTGLVKTAAIFTLIYWMYSGYAWLANQAPPDTIPRRITLIFGMAAFFICALAIPHAFDQSALAFSVGYLFVVIVHSFLYAVEHQANVWRFVPLNILGAVFLIGAAIAPEDFQIILWCIALGISLFVTYLASKVSEANSSGYNLKAEHFVERHGLLLIITFGESIIAIGIALGKVELTPNAYSSAIMGLILVAAMWWMFFHSDQSNSEHRMHTVPVERKVKLALQGYYFAFIPVILGIVLLSAGFAHAAAHIMHPIDNSTALLISCGTGFYLLGLSGFRYVFGLRPVIPRIVFSLLAFSTYWAGLNWSALAQVGLLIAIVLLALITESRDLRKDG